MYTDFSYSGMLLLNRLQEHKLTAEQVLTKAGLSVDTFRVGTDIVSVDQQVRLVRAAKSLLGDRLYPSAPLSEECFSLLGPSAWFMATQPTPLTALTQAHNMLDNIRPEAEGAVDTTFEHDGDHWCVILRVRSQLPTECFLLLEMLLEITTALVSRLTEAPLLPTSYNIAHPPQGGTARYHRVFPAPVRFNCEYYEIRYPEDLATTRCRYANQELGWQLLESLVNTTPGKPESLTSKVTSRIVGAIRAGEKINLQSMAASLDMTTRTLQHRLLQENSRFSDIFNLVRSTEAVHLLGSTELGVNSIAYQLGYSDPSSFQNAFRVWHGIPPGEFRRQLKG